MVNTVLIVWTWKTTTKRWTIYTSIQHLDAQWNMNDDNISACGLAYFDVWFWFVWLFVCQLDCACGKPGERGKLTVFFFFFIGICKTNIYIFLFYSFWVLLFFVVLHAKARLSRAVYFEGDSIWNRNRVVICVEMSLLALFDMYSILALSVINTFRMLIARNINAYIVVCSRYDEWRVCVDEMKWESEKFHRHRLTFCISTAILSSFIRQNEKWAIGRVIMVRVTGLITCTNTRESQRTAEKKTIWISKLIFGIIYDWVTIISISFYLR